MHEQRGARLQRWERTTEWPLTAAAVTFLVAYAWPILDPDLATYGRRAADVVVWTTWALFAVDLAIRLFLAPHRWHFLRSHVFDVASVLLPVLRPLRLLRLVTLVQVLNRRASSSLRGRVSTYLVASAVLLVTVSALAMLDAERGKPGSHIESFGDALWWAMTTVTTVGYGDMYPVTTTGRFIAAALMLAGIATLGVVTATFASWMVERVDAAKDEESALTDRIEDLTAEVRRLAALVAEPRQDN